MAVIQAGEIWLKRNKDDYFVFPINPPTIGYTDTRNFEDIVLANGDERTVISGKNQRTYSIKSYFPASASHAPFAKWNSSAFLVLPMDFVSKIKSWMDAKAVLQLQVTTTVINQPVTIRSFEWEENHVGDVDFTIELKEYIPVILEDKNSSTTSRPASQKDKSTTYTVKKGDTLFSIAKKQYGNGSQWKKIYDANKKVIGPNPNLIKLGQKLVIPR